MQNIANAPTQGNGNERMSEKCRFLSAKLNESDALKKGSVEEVSKRIRRIGHLRESTFINTKKRQRKMLVMF